MFFLKTANIMAWILVVVGSIRTLTALAFATIVLDHEKMIAFSKRYLGASTSGEAIESGLLIFAAGIVLGLLVIIAKNSSKNSNIRVGKE